MKCNIFIVNKFFLLSSYFSIEMSTIVVSRALKSIVNKIKSDKFLRSNDFL